MPFGDEIPKELRGLRAGFIALETFEHLGKVLLSSSTCARMVCLSLSGVSTTLSRSTPFCKQIHGHQLYLDQHHSVSRYMVVLGHHNATCEFPSVTFDTMYEDNGCFFTNPLF